MNDTNGQFQILEEIKSKAYQLDSISIVAQSSDLDGLNIEIKENLFGVMSDLSREILVLVEKSFSVGKSDA